MLRLLTSVPVKVKVDLNTVATEGAGGDKKLLRDLALHPRTDRRFAVEEESDAVWHTCCKN